MKIAYLLFCGLALVLPARFQGAAFLCAYVFVVYDPEKIPAFRFAGGGTVMAGDVVLLGMLARSLLLGASRLRQFVQSSGFWAPIVLMAGYFTMTVLGGSEFGQRHQTLCLISLGRSVGALLLGYSLALGLPDRKSVRISSYWIGAFLLVNAGMVCFNFIGSRYGITIGEIQGLERGEPRYFGPIGDSVGFVLALGFFVALARRSIVAMAFLGGAIAMTGTFGAALTVASGVVFWLLFSRRLMPALGGPSAGILLTMAVAGGVAIGVGYFWGGGDALLQRLQGSSGGVDRSVQQRLWSFGLAMDLFRNHPFTGVGYQGFADIYGNAVFTSSTTVKGDVANANNQILQVLSDGGLVMLAIFGWFAFEMFSTLRRAVLVTRDRISMCFFGGALIWFLALLIGNQSAAWLLPGSILTALLWVVFGHAVAMPFLVEDCNAPPARGHEPMAMPRGSDGRARKQYGGGVNAARVVHRERRFFR